MRKSTRTVIGAGMLASLGLGASANAALQISLRFADDTTSKVFTPGDAGNDVTVNVWAKVTGGDADFTNDGFGTTAFAGYRVLSSKTGTGVTPDILSSLTSASFTSTGSLNGTIQDLNADGVEDIGGSASASAQIDTVSTGGTDIKARAGVDVFHTSLAHEILLSSFTIDLAAISGSATLGNQIVYSLQVPSHQTLAANRPGSWVQDDATAPFTFTSTTGTSGQSPTNYTAGTSVTLQAAVPEPASMGLLGIGAIGLLSRRRRVAK